MFSFDVERKDKNTHARTGILKTAHGLVETPAYVIVGTHAEVRTLTPEDLKEANVQMIISNTYHLWRDLGDEGLNDYPGLHEVMRFKGPIMTDSGGFQVFSLGFLYENNMRRGGSKSDENKSLSEKKSLVRVTEAGVYFHPVLPGEDGMEEVVGGEEEMYLDAETSVKIQEQLGADIIVAFDEPTSPAHDYAYTKQAMERTHRWAERSLEAHATDQAMYGVVQGGAFEDLRKESASVIGKMPFDGFAIGSTYGDAYGGTKAKTAQMVEWAIENLPESKPRHLFGVGKMEDILAGVEAGIDTFDCVIPTREARHGRIWTERGHLDIMKSVLPDPEGPLDELCVCPVCTNPDMSRAMLKQMFKRKDMQAGRLATMHNVFFFGNFMARLRQAIKDDQFEHFKKDVLEKLKK